jgi:hypothetical protein
METECDFWILLVNISAQLEKASHQKLVSELRAMSPPTQAIMRRRLQHVLAELATVENAVSESDDA